MGKFVPTPMRNVVVAKDGRMWRATAYDERGYIRSGVSAPNLDYVKRKIAEYWPGLPVTGLENT